MEGHSDKKKVLVRYNEYVGNDPIHVSDPLLADVLFDGNGYTLAIGLADGFCLTCDKIEKLLRSSANHVFGIVGHDVFNKAAVINVARIKRCMAGTRNYDVKFNLIVMGDQTKNYQVEYERKKEVDQV